MRRIRVLVVDDSVVARRMVSDALSEDPAIEVVGVAANGRIALQKIDQLAPDAITLDVEMPELDGLHTLRAIRTDRPTLPVIMFSTLTARGAQATLDALAAGATDYVTKPSQVGKAEEAMARIRDQLVPRIKTFCGIAETPTTESVPPLVRSPRRPSDRVEAVAIGVSTGGPNALAALLPDLPADLAVPVFIVQHMPPVFTRFLAQRLDGIVDLTVREAEDGAVAGPGEIWIAPGDHHMIVTRVGTEVRIGLHQEPPEHSCRPAADVLMRSVADVYRSGALAVVLTGMGRDGATGCEQIRDVGGHVLAQDQSTSVVWGMPGYVARTGLADAVLPLDAIAAEVERRVEQGRRPHRVPEPR